MICIFSISTDNTTTEVMNWLHHWGMNDVIRINADDYEGKPPMPLVLCQGHFRFLWKGRWTALSEIGSVWYRKGKHWLCNQFPEVSLPGSELLEEYLRRMTQLEEYRLSEYLHHLIETSKPALGNAFRLDLNKMIVLEAAAAAGLRVPGFCITNSKEKIAETAGYASCITKALSETLSLYDADGKGEAYQSYTEPIDTALLEQLPDIIAPSFIQKYIEKQFELRVFYLDGQCYTMAILSQSDEQTRTDFRQYNRDKPNRFVPFLLPDTIEDKLVALFKRLYLNTGSVDILVDNNDDYYFLEINPAGQFGMVSAPCNYHLEKEVAHFLVYHEKNHKKDR